MTLPPTVDDFVDAIRQVHRSGVKPRSREASCVLFDGVRLSLGAVEAEVAKTGKSVARDSLKSLGIAPRSQRWSFAEHWIVIGAYDVLCAGDIDVNSVCESLVLHTSRPTESLRRKLEQIALIDSQDAEKKPIPGRGQASKDLRMAFEQYWADRVAARSRLRRAYYEFDFATSTPDLPYSSFCTIGEAAPVGHSQMGERALELETRVRQDIASQAQDKKVRCAACGLADDHGGVVQLHLAGPIYYEIETLQVSIDGTPPYIPYCATCHALAHLASPPLGRDAVIALRNALAPGLRDRGALVIESALAIPVRQTVGEPTIITRSISDNGNLRPATYDILKSWPDELCHNREHGALHPLAIYNRSCRRVLSAFGPLLDEIDAIDDAPSDVGGLPTYDLQRLMPVTKELLEAMIAHIDDAYHILRATTPKSKEHKPGEFVHRWLKRARHPTFSEFAESVRAYRSRVAPLVNQVKHDHKLLNGIVIVVGDKRIPGFYVEGVLKSGGIGPDRECHPNATGRSYFRSVREHFVHLFLIGRWLGDALIASARNRGHNIVVEPAQDESKDVAEVAARIARLPFIFGTGEVHLDAPSVSFCAENRELVLEYPSARVPWTPTGKIRTTASLGIGDGVTREFGLAFL